MKSMKVPADVVMVLAAQLRNHPIMNERSLTGGVSRDMISLIFGYSNFASVKRASASIRSFDTPDGDVNESAPQEA